MHLKLFLIFALVFGGFNLHAQYVPTTWGSGAAMGSNQMQCAHEYKTADMLVSGNKQVKADNKELSRLKKERRTLKRDVTKIKRQMARNKRALNNNFKRNIANLLMDHLEEGRSPDSYKSCTATNSSCDPINVETETTERKTQIDVSENNRNSEERIRRIRECNNLKNNKKIPECVESVNREFSNSESKKTVEHTVTDVTTFYTRGNRSSGREADDVFNKALRSILSMGTESNGAGNYDTPSEMCIPYRGDSSETLGMLEQQDGSTCINMLKAYSNSDGTLNTGICSAEVPIYSSKRDVSKCRDAIEEMNDLSADLQAKTMDLESLDYAIEDAEAALKGLKDDLFDEMVAEGKVLEVECETCDTPVYREKPSMWSNVAQLAGLGLGAAAAYFTADRISDKNARLGWPSNPYLGLQVGFPFVMAGIYGGILGGQSHGGYGCAGGVGGAGGGAFGYPPGMFGGPVSGGMYMPGMGPWGMPGPWSGWGQMGGGGFLGGIGMMGGGGYGGMPGYPGGYGGMPGGFGMAGGIGVAGGMGMPGYPGGYGMPGYPGGAGMAGGIGFIGGLGGGGIPGYPGGYGGIPGMAGGIGVAGGYGGMPGMPGYAGGYGGIPGMAGGIGVAGGYGGIPGMPGYAGGYGGIPGMAGGGYAGIAGGGGIAGGNSAYLQMQMQMMEQQQRQMQIQMETQMRKAQQQQQAVQTISALSQQIQQLQMQINTTYQGLYSNSYSGGASFNSNTLVNGIQLNSNIPTRPGSHR